MPQRISFYESTGWIITHREKIHLILFEFPSNRFNRMNPSLWEVNQWESQKASSDGYRWGTKTLQKEPQWVTQNGKNWKREIPVTGKKNVIEGSKGKGTLACEKGRGEVENNSRVRKSENLFKGSALERDADRPKECVEGELCGQRGGMKRLRDI